MTGVILDNGERVEADIVIMGVGIKPNVPKLTGIQKKKKKSRRRCDVVTQRIKTKLPGELQTSY